MAFFIEQDDAGDGSSRCVHEDDRKTQALRDVSAVRRRRHSSSSILSASAGCAFSTARKLHAGIDRVVTGVSATTLALRGPPSMRAISVSYTHLTLPTKRIV